MDDEHIAGALFDLMEVKFPDAPNAAARVVDVFCDSSAQVTQGKMPFRVCVLKKYLDMLEKNELCMRSVFEKMQHAYSVPGTRLLSTPYQCPRSRTVLPQFADSYEVCYCTIHTLQ